MTYGAFINLPIGFEGLLHKSELPESFALTVGQNIEVVLIKHDIELRRMSLGLSQNYRHKVKQQMVLQEAITVGLKSGISQRSMEEVLEAAKLKVNISFSAQ